MQTRKPKVKVMTPGIPHAARLRAYLAGAVVTVGLVGVAWRAWALQIDDGGRYRALAAKQHAMTIDIPAPRGGVIDVHGRSLAVSAEADSIWANPREIKDVTETAAKVARLVGGEAAALEAKLGGDRRFVWIDRHVTPEVARAVRAAKLPGIEVTHEPRRWYPGREIGGPVIGRADIDGHGLDGIELAMNELLTGRRGGATALRDARGRRMFADGVAQPEPGATVKLTLDRSIQSIADTALATAVESHQAKSGVVVVLDVATSRVLAMSSYPSFDPNTGIGIAAGARNRAVTDVFEAGSVMKLFTVAAALDDGVIAPDTWFDIQWGMMQVGAKPFKDVYHDQYLTTSGIIKRSSNVGAIKIAQRIGREKLYAALKRFGFGAKTGIELPGEQAGTLRAGAKWRDIELATIGFGYGLTVTPLQMTAALASIGNRGMYQTPRIVDRVTDAAGTVEYLGRSEARRVMKPETASALLAMMGTVFEGGKQPGTAAAIVVPGFKCGGKTGTARKWDAETKQYADRYLSSFAGLAPMDNPRLAIVVLVDEPSGGDYYGGKVAGPVFATVASEALRYLGVAGESLECPPPPPGPPVNPLLVTLAPKTCVKPAILKLAVPPVEPSPAVVEARLDDGGIPDFRGMGIGRAIDTARRSRIAIDVIGSGRVVEQDPLPGSDRPGSSPGRVKLRFSDGDLRSGAPAPRGP